MKFGDLKLLAIQMNNLKFKSKYGIVRDFEDINWFNDSKDINITDIYFDKTNLDFIMVTDIDDRCLVNLKDLELACNGICTKCSYLDFCMERARNVEKWRIKANTPKPTEEVQL